MCQTTLFKSPTCPHAWLETTKPCTLECPPDAENDLLTCPLFRNGATNLASSMPNRKQAKADDCPQCDFDDYDRRDYRMCTAVSGSGTTWGKKDWAGAALSAPSVGKGKGKKAGEGETTWYELLSGAPLSSSKKSGDTWGEYTAKGQVRPKSEWDVICCVVM